MACTTEQCTQTVQEIGELDSVPAKKQQWNQVDYENEDSRELRKHLAYQKALKELEKRKTRALADTFRLSFVR